MVGGYPWLPAIGLMLFSQGSCQPHEAQLPCAPQELTGLPEVADAGTTHPLRMSYLPSTQLLPGSTPESIATWGPAKFVAMDPRGGYFEDQVSRSAPQHEVHWGNPTRLTIPATASNVVGSDHPLYEPNLNFLELAQGAVLPNAPLRGRHTSDMGNTLFRPVAESQTLLPGAPVPPYHPVTLHTAGDPQNSVAPLHLPKNLQQPPWEVSTGLAIAVNPPNARVPGSQFPELLERYDAPALSHQRLDHQAFETSKSSPGATSSNAGLPSWLLRDLTHSGGGTPSAHVLQNAGEASKHLEPIPTTSTFQVSSALQVRGPKTKGGRVKALEKSARTRFKNPVAPREKLRGRPRKKQRLLEIFSPTGWVDPTEENPDITDSELEFCKRTPHVLQRVSVFSHYLEQLKSNPGARNLGVDFFSGYGENLNMARLLSHSHTYSDSGHNWQYLTSRLCVEAMELLTQGEDFMELNVKITSMAVKICNPYARARDPAVNPEEELPFVSTKAFNNRIIVLSKLFTCMIKSLHHYASNYVRHDLKTEHNLDSALMSFLTRVWNGFSGYVLESGEKMSSDEERCYKDLTKISRDQLTIQYMILVVDSLIETWLKERLPGMVKAVPAISRLLSKEVFHVALWSRAKTMIALLPSSNEW